MNHIEAIEESQHARLWQFSARYEDGFGYFRAHYPATNRAGKPIHRYIELRVEAGPVQRWTYRSGYMYNDAPEFWSVPDSHVPMCAPFARFVTERAAERLQRELRAISDAAFRAGVSIA